MGHVQEAGTDGLNLVRNWRQSCYLEISTSTSIVNHLSQRV